MSTETDLLREDLHATHRAVRDDYYILVGPYAVLVHEVHYLPYGKGSPHRTAMVEYWDADLDPRDPIENDPAASMEIVRVLTEEGIGKDKLTYDVVTFRNEER